MGKKKHLDKESICSTKCRCATSGTKFCFACSGNVLSNSSRRLRGGAPAYQAPVNARTRGISARGCATQPSTQRLAYLPPPLLATLAFSLATMWRYPHLADTHGPGPFLLAYLILLLTCGIPMLRLNLGQGQYSGRGALGAWGSFPLAQGAGAVMVLAALFLASCYQVVVAECLQIIDQVVRPGAWASRLPWEQRGAACLGDHCHNRTQQPSDVVQRWQLPVTLPGGQAANPLGLCFLVAWTATLVWLVLAITISSVLSSTAPSSSAAVDTSSTQEGDTSREASSVPSGASRKFKGLTRQAGMCSRAGHVFIQVLLPAVVLSMLTVHSAYHYGPDTWNSYLGDLGTGHPEDLARALARPHLWVDAAGQVLVSLGAGVGVALTTASREHFRHGIKREVAVGTLFTVAVSLCSSAIVANELSTLHLGDPETTAPGDKVLLAYGNLMARLTDNSPAWLTLFYLKVAALGLATVHSLVTSVVLSLADVNRTLAKYRAATSCCVALFLCLLALPCVQIKAPLQMLHVIDRSVTIIVLFASLAQVLTLAHLYGNADFSDDMAAMDGSVPGRYWRWSWAWVTPGALMASCGCGVVALLQGPWGDADLALTAVMLTVAWLQLPAWALWVTCWSRGYTWSQKMRATLRRSPGYDHRLLTTMYADWPSTSAEASSRSLPSGHFGGQQDASQATKP